MKKEIDSMKQLFDYSEENGELVFKSHRETSSQDLKKSGKLNKRKLNEFQFVINKIQNENFAFEIKKKHLYNRLDEKSFFKTIEKKYFIYQIFSDINKKTKLILPACYFGDINIFEWLLDHDHDVNDKNARNETGLHLGILE